MNCESHFVYPANIILAERYPFNGMRLCLNQVYKVLITYMQFCVNSRVLVFRMVLLNAYVSYKLCVCSKGIPSLYYQNVCNSSITITEPQAL